MSNKKTYIPLDQQPESRSVYLTPEEWTFLAKEGERHSPTRCIREMIVERRLRNEIRDSQIKTS